MDGTILSQGSFTQPATAVNQIVAVPSGIDWFMTYNKTQIDAGTASAGLSFYWQRGMPAGYAIEYQNNAGSTATLVTSVLTGGFTLYDPTATPTVSAPLNFTAITNATRPVISAASTAGISVGSVVRLSSVLVNGTTGTSVITDLAGQDFVVGAVTLNTSFTLLTAASAFANAPGITTGTGSFRVVNYPPLFYPRRIVITNIVPATGTVSTATAHGFTPGQAVRFNIPAVSGTTQLNASTTPGSNVAYTIATVVDDYDFTLNEDISADSAFVWPTVLLQPSSFPEVTPVGENTGFALTSNTNQVPSIGGVQIYNSNTGILADSTVNTGFLGMVLPTGVNSPGGIAADVVYWRAGKASFGGL